MESNMPVPVPVPVPAVVGEEYCDGGGERELTVRKTAMFYPGDGYAAYDHQTGDLVFRVENYSRRRGPSLSDHLVLMDPSGESILTVRRKWPSLHQRWEGFLGERKDGQKPLFSAKRSSIFGGDHCSIDVELHNGNSNINTDKVYRIDGSFAQRSCRVIMICSYDRSESDDDDEEEVVVAEIKRKVDVCSRVVLGKDVFCLCLKPHFDAAFAMGLVLILDQISNDEDAGSRRGIHVATVASFDEDEDEERVSGTL